MRGRPERGEANDVPKKTKDPMPPPKNEAASFERFEEFTKRIVQVPKFELDKAKTLKSRRKRS